MTSDRSALIRDAFDGQDALPPEDRERMWTALRARGAGDRRQRVAGAGTLVLAGVAVGAIATWQYAGARHAAGAPPPAAVAADSLAAEPLREPVMTQEPSTPTNLIPLLGHRSSLRLDIENFTAKRDELIRQIDKASGAEEQILHRRLADVEEDLQAAKSTLRAIDLQLSGVQGTPTPDAVIQFAEAQALPPDQPPPAAWFARPDVLWGASGGLVVLMLTVLVYLRHFARTTRKALAAIEAQVASQHTTLASGIDAIAVEVERLGEGQRFMSKVLAGGDRREETPAPRPAH